MDLVLLQRMKILLDKIDNRLWVRFCLDYLSLLNQEQRMIAQEMKVRMEVRTPDGKTFSGLDESLLQDDDVNTLVLVDLRRFSCIFVLDIGEGIEKR